MRGKHFPVPASEASFPSPSAQFPSPQYRSKNGKHGKDSTSQSSPKRRSTSLSVSDRRPQNFTGSVIEFHYLDESDDNIHGLNFNHFECD